MTILVQAPGRSAERALAGERVNKLKLFPHDHPSSGLLHLLDRKAAVFKTEIFAVFAKHPRKQALLKPFVVLSIATPVHEYVFLPTMSVEVTVHKNISTF